MNYIIPADVPADKHSLFESAMDTITKKTDRVFIFACDQTIEHLYDDFTDEAIRGENAEHFFTIGVGGYCGALATQLELIARYAKDYPSIPYIAKLNSKTNLIPATQKDPLSGTLWHVEDVLKVKENNVPIVGIGLTVYLGSEYEHLMMETAAQAIFDAHQHGLVAMVWMYLRGKAIKDTRDPHVLAGAAGAAHALGADIVKIQSPIHINTLPTIVAAAGNTKVICSGGSKQKPETFLTEVHEQIHRGTTAGIAAGRNIFQYPVATALSLTRATSAIIYDNQSVQQALSYVK